MQSISGEYEKPVYFDTKVKKFFFYYYNVGINHIVWKVFPFQLCSLAMYICLIIPFIKKEATKRALYNFLIAFNFPGGLISILIPSGLIHNYISLTIHAFLWHAILLFIGFYLFLSKRAGFDKTEFKSSLKYFCIKPSFTWKCQENEQSLTGLWRAQT